jgi:DNA-directed RNA polymerase subunit RPC12/RpoP
MTYHAPMPYKCIKCGYEFQYSQDHSHPAPVLSSAQNQSMPVCPQCWAKFLLENIGISFGTTNWTGVSDYDKEKNT